MVGDLREDCEEARDWRSALEEVFCDEEALEEVALSLREKSPIVVESLRS